jgi:hypothetical protein
MKTQINDISAKGMDVQLHIHPNWLLSEYKDGKWIMNIDHYKLHAFGFSDGGAEKVFSDAKFWLESCIHSVDKAYKCQAFRAGGFCIQPENDFIKLLLKHEISIDSSVAIQQVGKNYINDYNFTNVPKKLTWRISEVSGVCKEANAKEKGLLEIPIGSVRNNLFRFISCIGGKIYVKSATGRGSGIKRVEKPEYRLLKMLKGFGRRVCGYGILSLDTRGADLLKKDLDSIYRKESCDLKDQAICIICHPKLASDDTINNMKRFIKLVKKDKKRYKFITLSQAGKLKFNP